MAYLQNFKRKTNVVYGNIRQLLNTSSSWERKIQNTAGKINMFAGAKSSPNSSKLEHTIKSGEKRKR